MDDISPLVSVGERGQTGKRVTVWEVRRIISSIALLQGNNHPVPRNACTRCLTSHFPSFLPNPSGPLAERRTCGSVLVGTEWATSRGRGGENDTWDNSLMHYCFFVKTTHVPFTSGANFPVIFTQLLALIGFRIEEHG